MWKAYFFRVWSLGDESLPPGFWVKYLAGGGSGGGGGWVHN